MHERLQQSAVQGYRPALGAYQVRLAHRERAEPGASLPVASAEADE